MAGVVLLLWQDTALLEGGRLLRLSAAETSTTQLERISDAFVAILLHRVLYQALGAFGLMLLNAACAVLALLTVGRLNRDHGWWAQLILATNIAFLYYHSFASEVAITLLWFTSIVYLATREETSAHRLAGLLTGLGLGFDLLLFSVLTLHGTFASRRTSGSLKPYLSGWMISLFSYLLFVAMVVGVDELGSLLQHATRDWVSVSTTVRNALAALVILLPWAVFALLLKDLERTRSVSLLATVATAAFLIVYAEPWYALLLLPIVLVYALPVLLDAKWGRGVILSVAVLNLLVFFLLPADILAPPITSERLSEVERGQRHYFLHDVPIYSRVTESASLKAAAKELMRTVSRETAPNVDIVVSPRLAPQLNIEALHTVTPRGVLLFTYDPSVHRFASGGQRDTSLVILARESKRILYLGLVGDSLDLGASQIFTNGELQLVEVDTSRRLDFVDRYVAKYFRTYH